MEGSASSTVCQRQAALIRFDWNKGNRCAGNHFSRSFVASSTIPGWKPTCTNPFRGTVGGSVTPSRRQNRRLGFVQGPLLCPQTPDIHTLLGQKKLRRLCSHHTEHGLRHDIPRPSLHTAHFCLETVVRSFGKTATFMSPRINVERLLKYNNMVGSTNVKPKLTSPSVKSCLTLTLGAVPCETGNKRIANSGQLRQRRPVA
jgi:hypothetical protein